MTTYVYNNVRNVQDLANVLASFPAGSVDELYFTGHGASGVGVQVGNNDTYAPANSQDIDQSTLGAFALANAAGFTAMAQRLTNNAKISVEACGGSPTDTAFQSFRDEAGQNIANLFDVSVYWVVGRAGGWGELKVQDGVMAYWVYIDPNGL